MELQSTLVVAFAELSGWLGMPWEWVALLGLLLIALAGHIGVSFLLRHLHAISNASATHWDDAVVSAISGPARFAWWLALVALLLTMVPWFDAWQAESLKALRLALVLLVPWFLHRLITNFELAVIDHRLDGNSSTDKATVRAAARLLRVSLWLVTVLMILQTMGVSVSGLLAFGGIGGIAIGFAAKDLLANFFGGLGIYLDRPFTIGDWIRSPDRSIEGVVEDIGWRITRIRTFDKRPLYVPNSVFGQITIENPSRMLNRRIYERFGLRYDDGSVLAGVITAIEAMIREHDAIDQQQTVMVNFEAFGASSLDCFVYCLTRTTNWAEFHAVKQDVLLKVMNIIHDHGADIAFPTRTVQIAGVPGVDAP